MICSVQISGDVSIEFRCAGVGCGVVGVVGSGDENQVGAGSGGCGGVGCGIAMGEYIGGVLSGLEGIRPVRSGLGYGKLGQGGVRIGGGRCGYHAVECGREGIQGVVGDDGGVVFTQVDGGDGNGCNGKDAGGCGLASSGGIRDCDSGARIGDSLVGGEGVCPELAGGCSGSGVDAGLGRGRLDSELTACGRGGYNGSRGVHYSRNKRRREAARRQRSLEKVVVPEVVVETTSGSVLEDKSRSGLVVGSGDAKGFFAGCSEKLRLELQESRAKRLIAENQAAEAEAVRRHRHLVSTVAFAQDFTRGMNAVRQLEKVTKGTNVRGWAETVSSSVAESLARSAPSTVPSLESVGLGSSSLESSAKLGLSCDVNPRLAEYEEKETKLRSSFDELEMVAMEDIETAVNELRAEYADVLLTPKELALKEITKNVVDGLVRMDLSMVQRMQIVDLFAL